MLLRFCCHLQQGPGNEVPLLALSAYALCVPVCRVAPGFFGCGSRAGQDPASLLFVAPVLSALGWLMVPVSMLLCRFCLVSSSLSIPRGFPPLPRNALSDIGSAPSFFV